MTVLVAESLEHAQAIIRGQIESGQYDVARKTGRDNNVPPDWVEKRIEVWHKYRTWKPEPSAPEEWFTPDGRSWLRTGPDVWFLIRADGSKQRWFSEPKSAQKFLAAPQPVVDETKTDQPDPNGRAKAAEAKRAEPEPEKKIIAELIMKLPADQREAVVKALNLKQAGVSGVEFHGPPLGFQYAKSVIPASLENAMTAIEQLKIECKYDVFHDRIIVDGRAYGWGGNVLGSIENIGLKIREVVVQRFKFDTGVNHTHDALRINCLNHTFDPVLDYLTGLQWDGKPRLDNWLVQYCGADDTPLNRAIGRKMLVAAVRRVRCPGCKFDFIIVFESVQQGIGKSTAIKILAGEENYSDAEIISQDKREQQEAIQGVWIYEFGELEGMWKSDVRKVKSFASRQVDSARPAYGRSRADRPRRCIIIATTNERNYLRDVTGNRRFWPVLLHGVILTPSGLKMIDLEGLVRDRDQLWAEAAWVEAGGEELVIPQNLWAAVEVVQLARMEADPWIDVLAGELAKLESKTEAQLKDSKYFGGRWAIAADANGDPEWRVASGFLLSDVLDVPKERQHHNHAKRLVEAMSVLGWQLSSTTLRIGEAITRGYRKAKPKELGK